MELRETHISWVFLTPSHAYKVKKPLRLPFLDYGSLERRHRMCVEELRQNRRFAPGIYLDVVGIARSRGCWKLVPETDPDVVEYAVRMRRIDESQSLAARSRAGRLRLDQIEAVARRVAELHREAPAAAAPMQRVDDLRATLSENHATLSEAGAAILERARLEAAEHFTAAVIDARGSALEARAGQGLIRDCHGDLRAEHVILPEEGAPYIFDCIEFDRSLREIDVAADLAFLVMDLAALGEDEMSAALVDAYRRAGGDPGDDVILSFFAAYRAWVRSKVACLRLAELAAGAPERAAELAAARRLFELGERFAWRARRPLVLVFCGVAASGKTTLAGRVAAASGWARLSSDVVRKQLAGIDPHARAAEQLYSAEFTERTYRELGCRAAAELARAGSVIVDATFHRRDARARFLAGLGGDGSRVLFVECRAPSDVLISRAREREADPDRISDAGPGIVRRQLAEAEPLAELAAASRTVVDTTCDQERLLARVGMAADLRSFSEPADAPRHRPSTPIGG